MQKLKLLKGRIILYLILLLAALSAMASLRDCRRHRLPAVETGSSGGDTLDVGILYGPLSYYMRGDTISGINYDIIRLLGRDLGRPVRFWPVVNITDGLRRLSHHRFHILASLPSGNSHKDRFIFTRSVFLDRLVLVQLPGADGKPTVTSALHLAGDTVYIPADSPAADRLRNLSREIGEHVEIMERRDLSEEYLCMKVATGELKYAVVNEKTALAMKENYPALDIENPVSFTQFQVWALNRADTTLLRSIDSWLSDFENTNRYKHIISVYED